MTDTIATLLAAHARGQATDSDDRGDLRAHRARMTIRRFSYAVGPKAEALADRSGAARTKGAAGKPLYGVPFVVKDNIDVAGLPTTAACPAFAYTPERSAFVVERLERAGAIVIGKTNLDQFATGLVGVRSPYGDPPQRAARRSHPRRLELGLGDRGRRGTRARSRSAPTPRARGACRRRSTASSASSPRSALFPPRGVVPACRTLDTISIFALDVADAFAVFQAAVALRRARTPTRARFPAPALSDAPAGLGSACRARISASSSATRRRQRAFARDLRER